MIAEIVQIMPAGGWVALYDEEGQPPLESPLIGWALQREENGDMSVVGLDTDNTGYIEDPADSANFLRYELRSSLGEDQR